MLASICTIAKEACRIHPVSFEIMMHASLMHERCRLPDVETLVFRPVVTVLVWMFEAQVIIRAKLVRKDVIYAMR